MNLLVIILLLAVLIGLSYLRLNMLVWLAIWPIAVLAFLRLGISPPIPSSVLNIYLGLTILALIVYVFVDASRYKDVSSKIYAFLVEPRYNTALRVTMVILPLLLAWKVYLDMSVDVKAPTFGRTIHPAPPGEISFKSKKIDLLRDKNPYRELETKDPAAFGKHLENGKRVYYQNCVFCHGDDLRGDGMFAHGYNPVPANFNSATTIAMLQEAYLFWRIAKGGPGLPEESGPWSSSMPAWELFLSEEEIWDVIIFLYEHTGLKPREEEVHEH